jgi:hypothetical protein
VCGAFTVQPASTHEESPDVGKIRFCRGNEQNPRASAINGYRTFMFKNNISAAYVLLVGLPLLLLLGVLQTGSSLPAPVSVAVEHSPAIPVPAPLNLIQLVLQIGVILVVARIVGMLFRKIRQPQVIGEMVAGILLGPSFLGWGRPSESACPDQGAETLPARNAGRWSALRSGPRGAS